MAEKKLVMEFGTAGGGKTTMTLSDAKQDLNETTVKEQMQAMITSGIFETEKGAAFTSVISASYVEEIETLIFDTENTISL